MTQDVPHAFRGAMRRLATTVSIVTCAEDGDWFGMTATAVTSVCADPATVLVCINSATSVHRPLRATGQFCVNLLRSCQADLSRIFSGKLRGSERFTSGHWEVDERGLPFLREAQANLFCRVDQVIPYETHGIFIGRVNAVRFTDEVAPLIYQNGCYASTLPLVEAIV